MLAHITIRDVAGIPGQQQLATQFNSRMWVMTTRTHACSHVSELLEITCLKDGVSLHTSGNSEKEDVISANLKTL